MIKEHLGIGPCASNQVWHDRARHHDEPKRLAYEPSWYLHLQLCSMRVRNILWRRLLLGRRNEVCGYPEKSLDENSSTVSAFILAVVTQLRPERTRTQFSTSRRCAQAGPPSSAPLSLSSFHCRYSDGQGRRLPFGFDSVLLAVPMQGPVMAGDVWNLLCEPFTQ